MQYFNIYLWHINCPNYYASRWKYWAVVMKYMAQKLYNHLICHIKVYRKSFNSLNKNT